MEERKAKRERPRDLSLTYTGICRKVDDILDEYEIMTCNRGHLLLFPFRLLNAGEC